jgi:hypothetical protein
LRRLVMETNNSCFRQRAPMNLQHPRNNNPSEEQRE